MVVISLGTLLGSARAAHAAWCSYVSPVQEEQSVQNRFNDRGWGPTDLSNPTCTAIPAGSVNGSAGTVAIYHFTYTDNAEGNFSAGQLGLRAGASTSEGRSQEQNRSFAVSLPTERTPCIALEIEGYDRYQVRVYRQHLQCFSRLGTTDYDYDGGRVRSVPWGAWKPTRIRATVEEYQNSNIRTLSGPTRIRNEECPDCAGRPRVSEPRGPRIEDPDLERGNRRELGFAPRQGEPREPAELACATEDGTLATLERNCVAAAERLADLRARDELLGELAVIRAMASVAPTAEIALGSVEAKVAVARALEASLSSPALAGDAGLVARMYLLELLGSFTPPPGATVPSVDALLDHVWASDIGDDSLVFALGVALHVWMDERRLDHAAATIALKTSKRPDLAPRTVVLWAEAQAARERFQPAIRALAPLGKAGVIPLAALAEQARAGMFYEDELDALYVALRHTDEPTVRAELMRRVSRAYLHAGAPSAAGQAARAARCVAAALPLPDEARETWLRAIDVELAAAERALAAALAGDAGGEVD